MKIKKYGIDGLLEWHGTLSFNGSKIKVSFTGGTTTHFGVAPASFSTSNSIIQYIIENSEQFKKGFIKLIRVYDVADVKTEAPKLKLTPKAEPKVEIPKAETLEDKSTDTIGTFTEVEFTCVDDAKDFFSEKFGDARSTIRNRAQAEEAAKKHSFIIKWI